MRILFLEDNLSFAESILFILNENGHTVDFTESTTHAIQLFDTHPYDAVISDIHLKSEASGMELIKHIRHKRKSNVTVIVTTGLDLIDENEIKKRGVDVFLYKPLRISFPRFVSLIAETVHKKRI